MSDIPEKAVEAAAQSDVSFDGRGALFALGKADRLRYMQRAEEVLSAAILHLASAQPHPSKSDEETARSLAVELVDGVFGFTFEFNINPDQHRVHYDVYEERVFQILAKARAKALDECEAIARAEETANASVNGTEAARRIKKKIAALRAP